MDPSHFRGSQPPTSHVVPGASGIHGHPPHLGFIEPPFIIPGAFLTETIMAIRNEFSGQNRLLNHQYSGLKQELCETRNEMKERFELCVHQTDRILTEQHARFELRLEGIREVTRKFHESQATVIASFGGRLDALEGLTETSRDTLASELATVVETMGHGFNGLAAMIKNNEYHGERSRLLIPSILGLTCNLDYSYSRPVLFRTWDTRI